MGSNKKKNRSNSKRRKSSEDEGEARKQQEHNNNVEEEKQEEMVVPNSDKKNKKMKKDKESAEDAKDKQKEIDSSDDNSDSSSESEEDEQEHKDAKQGNKEAEEDDSDADDDNDQEDNDDVEGDDAMVVEENGQIEAPDTTTTPAIPTTTTTLLHSDGRYHNKQRCLILCSRGITARYRHLMEDLRTLIPHHKKETKLDIGKHDSVGHAINDIAMMRNCNTILYLESRKRLDSYMWMGRVNAGSSSGPGPSVKFHVTNMHTMDELRLTGNCMKGSRPILSFDKSFHEIGHLKLLKELFIDVFGTPRGHPKSKPFIDRVMSFYYADQRIWVRNYQILEEQPTNAMEAHQVKKLSGQQHATSLVEIGPRFVLQPIRIFRGSFGGQTLYQNPTFVSPNMIRSLQRRKKGMSYEQRKETQKQRLERKTQLILPEDPLDSVFK